LMTSAEARTEGVQLLAMSPVMKMNESQKRVISSAGFKKLVAEVAPMLSQFMAMLETNRELVNFINEIRASPLSSEGSIRSQLMLKAADWFQGGVDEVTFIAQVSPLIRKSILQPVDQEKIAKSFETFQQLIENYVRFIDPDQMGSFSSSPEIMAFYQQGHESLRKYSAQYAPDISRNIFFLRELDKSGRLTQKDLNLLKALVDGFLRIRTSTLTDKESLPEADKAELKKMYPDLFVVDGAESPALVEEVTGLLLAIFDVVDRDCDGSLQQDETVHFIMGFVSFIVQHMRIMSKIASDNIPNVMVDMMVSMEKEKPKFFTGLNSVCGGA